MFRQSPISVTDTPWCNRPKFKIDWNSLDRTLLRPGKALWIDAGERAIGDLSPAGRRGKERTISPEFRG